MTDTTPDPTGADPALLVSVDGRAGIITLNRPKALNALTLEMVRELEAALDRFEADPDITTVVLTAAGDRAFCAGGDIRALHDAAVATDWESPRTFWAEEYHLNGRIGRYAKPVVAVLDGITMGGGIGLAGHASHRVVSERASLAMPEVGIGFAPDVGGTWLLARAPGELGTHLALTGGRVGHADAIHLGLADAHVPHDALDDLVSALATDDPDAAIAARRRDPGPAPLAAARAWIDDAYASDDPTAIVARLREIGGDATAAADAVDAASPTSVTVALRALRTAAELPSLEAALEMEYRISTSIVEHPDFVEGVRAAVVDKDRSPRWHHDDLAAAAHADLDGFFAPRDHDIELQGDDRPTQQATEQPTDQEVRP